MCHIRAARGCHEAGEGSARAGRRGDAAPVSTMCFQGSVRRTQDAAPNQFNTVAGSFFFPLIQHFDR